MVEMPSRRSRVLVLENLVDPEMVDEFLRDEVKQECEKYGDILNCIVHQLTSEGVQFVRVFVEFDTERESEAAFMDLSVRTFSGK